MAKPPFDVVVVGNVGIDTNIYLSGKDVDFNVETNFTQNLDYIGQAGGYASRGYAALGVNTAFIGCVGDDYHGRFIAETLQADAINLDGLFIDLQGTSRSVNIMNWDGSRKNFYDGKGHMHLTPPLEICKSIFKRARLAHFNIPNWARQLLPIARECGVVVAVDIQDVVDIDDPYRKDFIDAANYLFFSGANQADPESIILKLLQRQPEQLIVAGMGAKGCLLGSQETGIKSFHAIEMDLPVVDTNGAGDSLAVGFLTGRVLEGLSLEESIRQGQIAARYCCSQKASTDSLIKREQMKNYLESPGVC